MLGLTSAIVSAYTHTAAVGGAVDAVITLYWDDDLEYFRAFPVQEGRLPQPAGYWNHQEATHLLASAVLRGRRNLLPPLYRAIAASTHGSRSWVRPYFDDMNWAVLALIEAADATGDKTFLTQAVDLFDGQIMAHGTDQSKRCGGGLWWDMNHTQKATASNAGPALAAALLSNRTGDPKFLEAATTFFQFWKVRMTDPVTGAVSDHLDTSIDTASVSRPPSDGLSPARQRRRFELQLRCGAIIDTTSSRRQTLTAGDSQLQ